MRPKDTTRRDLFSGALDLMVLKCLEREPTHAYALIPLIQAQSKGLLKIEEGSLYVVMKRLLMRGLVEAKWQTFSPSRRLRIYRINGAGRRYLSQEMTRFENMLRGIIFVLGNSGALTENPETSDNV